MKNACSEQFRGEIVQFTVDSGDFVRKMHGPTILTVACYVSQPFDIYTHQHK